MEEKLLPLAAGPSGKSRIICSVRVDNLSYSIPQGKVRKPILSNVTASFQPGTCTALMGPSGAGKTSLLNVLCGNVRSSNLSGSVLVNEEPVPDGFKRISALVPQDDILLTSLTPQDTLMYSARLRLPPGTDYAGRVSSVLRQLSLYEHRDTVIGSVAKRGLSGGQRKRVSIALELLIDPSVLFVDEPTSGLDSKMAEDVVALLVEMAREQRRTIICTIHAPSWRIFSSFDKLVLLNQGRVVFAGAVDTVERYFAGIGFVTPTHENPADFFMRSMQLSNSALDDDDAVSPPGTSSSSSTLLPPADDDVESTQGCGKRAHPLNPAGWWSEQWCAHVRDRDASGQGAKEAPIFWQGADLDLVRSKSYSISRWRQWAILGERFAVDYASDRSKMIGGAVLKFLIGVVVGVCWLNQARPDDDNLYSSTQIFPIQGALFVCCFSGVMDTLFPTITLMPTTKVLLLREYRNGMYSLPPYYFALLCNSVFFQSMNSIIMGVPIYLLVGLSTDTWVKPVIFLLNLSLMSSIGAALGLFLGSLVENLQQAQQIGKIALAAAHRTVDESPPLTALRPNPYSPLPPLVMPTLVPLELFCGYISPYNKIPIYFRWLYDVSPNPTQPHTNFEPRTLT